jgi:DNA repair exonuclease SbcCD ATPase subunit
MFRYAGNHIDPVTGQRYVQPELQIPLDAYHVMGRMEEYILAFQQGLESIHASQASVTATLQQLNENQNRLETKLLELRQEVSGLVEEYRRLQEDKPVPAHRCPGCEEVKTLDSFPDGDYLCGDCRG